jgi:magnesium-transporting ATPase (P-type)
MPGRDDYDYDYYEPERPRRAQQPPPPEYEADWGEQEPARRRGREPERGRGYERAPPPQQKMPPKPKPVRTGEILSPKAGIVIVLIGVILFFVGMILLQAIYLVESPEYEDFEDEDDPQEELDKADESYEDTTRSMNGSGRILSSIGALFISMPLYIIGIGSEKLDWKIRASMLSMATAIVVATMIVYLFRFSIY